MDLYRILLALRNKDIKPALECVASPLICTILSLVVHFIARWVEHNRDFLQSHSSSLEFYLHRSEYLRLLSPNPSEQSKAIEYANDHLQPFFTTHPAELKRLMGCLIFLPKERMQKSPYEDLTSETIHLDLENMFATEFSASLGMSKQPPLRVVGDIGGGGALAKIEKGRKIMRERKSEWSQTDELPVGTWPWGLLILFCSHWRRSKFRCLLRTGTIRSLRALCPKISPRSRTRR